MSKAVSSAGALRAGVAAKSNNGVAPGEGMAREMAMSAGCCWYAGDGQSSAVLMSFYKSNLGIGRWPSTAYMRAGPRTQAMSARHHEARRNLVGGIGWHGKYNGELCHGGGKRIARFCMRSEAISINGGHLAEASSNRWQSCFVRGKIDSLLFKK